MLKTRLVSRRFTHEIVLQVAQSTLSLVIAAKKEEVCCGFGFVVISMGRFRTKQMAECDRACRRSLVAAFPSSRPAPAGPISSGRTKSSAEVLEDLPVGVKIKSGGCAQGEGTK
jgi:hypothetical protein